MSAVAAKEILDALAERTFLLWFLICVVVGPASLALSYRSWRMEAADYDHAVAAARAQVEANTNWGTLASTGVRVYRQPTLLGAIASGPAMADGRSALVAVGRFPRLDGSRADSNPLYGVFGPFDILYLFKVIASLFALLFMYDAVSGEKESGALRLVFANAVPRRSVLAGKILGRLACALVPLVTPLLIGLLVLQAVSPAPFTADEWREIAVLAGVLVSYVVVFAMLGIAISTLTTRAFESLVASVAVWLLFLIVIPQSAGMAATAVYPAGSRAEAEERKLVAMNLRLGEARDEQTRYLRDHPLAGTTPDDYRRWMDAMREWARDLQQRVLSDVAAVEARIAEEQEAQQSRQARAAHAIARLSPAWLLTEAVTTLTGTNYEERVRFLASVRTYNWDFAAYVTDKRFASNDAMNLLSTETRLALDDFPQFEYRPGRPSVGTVAMDVLGLACFGIAFFAVAHAAFVRYDVR